MTPRRAALVVVLLALVGVGATWAWFHGHFRFHERFRQAAGIGVQAADGGDVAVTARTRRLRLQVDLGGTCVGEPRTASHIDRATVEETGRSVQVRVRVRVGAEPVGACAGVGTGGRATVVLSRPLGTRRIYNPDGMVDVAHVNRSTYRARYRSRFDFPRNPVVLLRRDRIHVVVRTNRALPRGARIQLDESRDSVVAARRRTTRPCVSATLDARADPVGAPELVDARDGQRVWVVLRLGSRVLSVSRAVVRRVAAGRAGRGQTAQHLRRLRC